MSQRSIRRNHEREVERRVRRELRTSRKVALAAGSAAAAVALVAPNAEAADYPVTNTNDAGPGSLRQAVNNANANPGADTVNATSISGTVRLTSGEISITDTVAITGPGSGSLTVSGDADASGGASPADSRVFYAYEASAARASVAISGLTVSGGYSQSYYYSYTYGGTTYSGYYGTSGGGINSYGPALSLNDVTVSGNVASGDGGGLSAGGDQPIALVNSKVTNNVAFRNQAGASIYTYGSGAGATVANTTISGNRGISEDPDPSVAGGGNSSVGGLSIYGAGAANVSNSTISGNSARVGAGGLSIGRGAKLSASTVSGNAGGNGGVTIYSNLNTYSSASNRPSSIVNSTISSNVAQSTTYTYGSNVYIYGGRGGGVTAYGELVSIANSTIAGNIANRSGGGINFYDFDDAGSTADDADNALDLSSTIVADNTAAGVAGDLGTATNNPTPSNSSVFGLELSLIESPGTASTATAGRGTNLVGVDPQLGALGNNGGPTQTQLPAPTSPAIDSGAANGLSGDQRNFARTFDATGTANTGPSDGTDIGAVELQRNEIDTEVTGAKVRAKKNQKQKGKRIKVKVKVAAAEVVTAKASGQIGRGKKKMPFKTVTKTIAPNKFQTLVLKLKKKKDNKKVFKVLKRGKKVKATLSVTLTDQAGNTFTKKPTTKLKLKKKKGKK